MALREHKISIKLKIYVTRQIPSQMTDELHEELSEFESVRAKMIPL